ncbi:MAG: carbohydrate-binding domain-containing protein [Paludibacteraceae bacterium]|nr:carbohydrate-binding domain-containing protein [Paludibacteraceae bacterium]MBQ6985218.1 carbohydrate-binding domain-containing protein [Paludibacteraceae bacterium]
MRKYYLLCILLLSFVSCDNSSTGNGVSNTTNSGDDTSDFVDNETWSSTINIVWNGTDVTVTGSADGVSVTNDNGYVTVTSTAKNIEFAVSGNGKGQLSIYSDYKYKLSLEGLTLACSDGPAINNQCHKTCYAVLGGTNTLSDGSSYASSSEDRKAAFFSEGQICFSGSGRLNVTGNYKHALASDDYIRLCSGTGTIDLTAKVSDGLHTNDGVIINDGTLTINAVGEGIQCDTSSVVITGGTIDITSTTDKGILAYANIDISGGTTTISSKYKCIKTESNLTISGGTITAVATGSSSSSGTPEGIEAKGTITISGGQVYAQANDDAINSGGEMTITGGYVMAYSTGNDGLDANGNMYIKGGLVYAICAGGAEVALDANTEDGYKLYVQGGTLVAIGGLENGASLSQNCYSASSWNKNTWYALTVGNNVFAFKTPSSGGSTLVVSGASTPTLTSGVTPSGTSIFNSMAYYPASVSGGSSVTLSTYSGGNSGGGPGGGGNPGGGGPGGW